jgi:hypothetical protein
MLTPAEECDGLVLCHSPQRIANGLFVVTYSVLDIIRSIGYIPSPCNDRKLEVQTTEEKHRHDP